MERTYFVRGKQVTVEELEDVVAVQTEGAEARAGDESGVVRDIARAQAGPEDRRLTDQQLSAFAAAGWVFVRASEEMRRALATRQALPNAEKIARVFLHPNGRILLGTDQLTVRLDPSLTEEECRRRLEQEGLTIIRKLRFKPNLYEVKTRPGVDFLDASVRMHDEKDIEYAEPQFIEHIGQRFHPTDPNYGDQWHLNNTGQGGGTAGADISAEEAWDSTRGAGARLAVVDNGFDVGHPDLAAGIAAGSGFFDDDSNFVVGLGAYPDSNHGTFCAGMAAARANNGEDGCGVANQADFIAVACLIDQLGTQATLARALAYAADPTMEVGGADPANGADVISCSLGPNGADWEMEQVLEDAIDFVVTSGRGGLGTPIFWAVTNGNFEIQFDEVCSNPNVIAVGRSTRNDDEDDSGFGPELQFLAPGVDVSSTESGGGFGASTGTSFAAPTAAGVGALVLAVNPDLAWTDVRQVMRDTCDKIGALPYVAGRNDDFGFGRVNAARAVCQAGRIVDLETPTIMFTDVPEGELAARAIRFSVRTCLSTTFQIISGPTVTSGPGSFGTLPSPSASLPATGTPQLRQSLLWISFTGANDGDVTAGEVTVRLNETGDEFLIPITANTIAQITVGAVLVLDQSGSMNDPSGLANFPTRADVLKFAAPHFVNVLPEGDGVGIVAFDLDAVHRMDVTVAGPVGPFDATRAQALGVLTAYAPTPGGLTAIGDGVEAASLAPVAAGSVFDERAIVVFTDGHETAAQYIVDVLPLINDRVFAIGLGTADQIQPNALTQLTNGTGGFMLLTGNLGSDDVFLLSKYYLQIMAGVTNQDIVLDPEGAVLPGAKHRIPFRLNEADITADVILLTESPASVLNFALETPAGDLITPANAGTFGGTTFTTHQSLGFYRMTLPVPIGGGAKAGKWHIVLTVDPVLYKRYLSSLDNDPKKYQSTAAHGIRYSVSVQSSSGLRLQASMLQTSNEPGATLTIRGILTEYGIPIESNRASVKAEIERPDGTGLTPSLTEVEPGVYEVSLTAAMAGVYRVRVLAAGSTMRNRPFTREHLLSGVVWKGGDQRPPNSHDDPDRPDKDKERLCRLLACLLGGGVITPDLERKLAANGFNLDALRKCLGEWCRPDRKPIAPKGKTATNASIANMNPKVAELILQLTRELKS